MYVERKVKCSLVGGKPIRLRASSTCLHEKMRVYLELRGADHTPAIGILALLEPLPQSLSTPSHVPRVHTVRYSVIRCDTVHIEGKTRVRTEMKLRRVGTALPASGTCCKKVLNLLVFGALAGILLH